VQIVKLGGIDDIATIIARYGEMAATSPCDDLHITRSSNDFDMYIPFYSVKRAGKKSLSR